MVWMQKGSLWGEDMFHSTKIWWTFLEGRKYKSKEFSSKMVSVCFFIVVSPLSLVLSVIWCSKKWDWNVTIDVWDWLTIGRSVKDSVPSQSSGSSKYVFGCRWQQRWRLGHFGLIRPLIHLYTHFKGAIQCKFHFYSPVYTFTCVAGMSPNPQTLEKNNSRCLLWFLDVRHDTVKCAELLCPAPTRHRSSCLRRKSRYY